MQLFVGKNRKRMQLQQARTQATPAGHGGQQRPGPRPHQQGMEGSRGQDPGHASRAWRAAEARTQATPAERGGQDPGHGVLSASMACGGGHLGWGVLVLLRCSPGNHVLNSCCEGVAQPQGALC